MGSAQLATFRGVERILDHQNPVVLLHGLGASPDQWVVVGELIDDLGLSPHAPLALSFGTPEDRGLEVAPGASATLIEQVETIWREGGYRRLVLIGHSMGGLDARWLASPSGGELGQKVAAVLTVATPHLGSELADVLDDAAPEMIRDLVGGLFAGLDLTADEDVAVAALSTLTTELMAEWSAHIVDHPEVRMYSVSTWQEAHHRFAPLLLSGLIVAEQRRERGLDPRNDGMVSEESGRWGHHLATWEADHLDPMGINTTLFDPFFADEFWRTAWIDVLATMTEEHNAAMAR